MILEGIVDIYVLYIDDVWSSYCTIPKHTLCTPRQIAFSAMVCNAARGPVESEERPVFRFKLRPPTAELKEKMTRRRGSDCDSSSSWNTDTDEDSDAGSTVSTMMPVRNKLTTRTVTRSASVSAPSRSPKSPAQKLSATIGKSYLTLLRIL